MILIIGFLSILAGLVLVVINANIVWLPRNTSIGDRRGERFAVIIACTLTVVVAVGILGLKYLGTRTIFARWPIGIALVVLGVPIMLTALPLFIHTERARGICESVVAVVLGMLIVLGGFSIGVFYILSALAMLVAAALARPGVPPGKWPEPSIPGCDPMRRWVWASQLLSQ